MDMKALLNCSDGLIFALLVSLMMVILQSMSPTEHILFSFFFVFCFSFSFSFVLTVKWPYLNAAELKKKSNKPKRPSVRSLFGTLFFNSNSLIISIFSVCIYGSQTSCVSLLVRDTWNSFFGKLSEPFAYTISDLRKPWAIDSVG